MTAFPPGPWVGSSRASRHYLMLRADPELRLLQERDRVRAGLTDLSEAESQS